MELCAAVLCIAGAVAIEGDTIRLDSPGQDLRLRVWGINAPEIRDPGGIEDSLPDGLAEKWQIDGPALVDKLRGLTFTQEVRLIEEIESFWAGGRHAGEK